MRTTRLAALALAVLVAACNEGPFIQNRIDSTIDKPVDTVLEYGLLYVCYENDAQLPASRALAGDTCASYGLEARLEFTDRYQCRLTTPHRAVFRCYHPDMVDAQGKYINPLNQAAVAAWRKRTGKDVPPEVHRNPEAPRPSAEALGAPPPAKVTPVPPPAAPVPRSVPAPAVPKSPAPPDMPAWPQPPALPVPPPAPLSVPAPVQAPTPAGAFTLPVGTWGDAFERE